MPTGNTSAPTHRALKGKLARAIKTQNPETVKATAIEAIRIWNKQGFWPDDWSNWQRALDDVYFPDYAPSLDELEV
jgi:hypothetical protein